LDGDEDAKPVNQKVAAVIKEGYMRKKKGGARNQIQVSTPHLNLTPLATAHTHSAHEHTADRTVPSLPLQCPVPSLPHAIAMPSAPTDGVDTLWCVVRCGALCAVVRCALGRRASVGGSGVISSYSTTASCATTTTR
jgi:hypothetical protein